jgi:hypothetical protein
MSTLVAGFAMELCFVDAAGGRVMHQYKESCVFL